MDRPIGASGTQTALAHYAEDRREHYGAVIPPIFETSLFTFASVEDMDAAFEHGGDRYVYTRGNNPTTVQAEEKIAFLEKGEKAKLFGSGMAAISAAILHCAKAGSHIVCVNGCYGVTRSLLTSYLPSFGVESTFVDGTSIAEIEAAVRPNTTLIYLESPTSLLFEMQDVRAVASFARSRGIRTVIDNSWATPVFQNPLTLGVDIVVHTASKYLGGHSDVVAGVLIASEAIAADVQERERAMLGGVIGPFESWLILRGVRTLGIRMQRHQQSALAVAAYLASHPKVRVVHYPGLQNHPQYELGLRQMSGFSGLMSLELDSDLAGARRFVNSLRFFKIGVSWGGFESLAVMPFSREAEQHAPQEWAGRGIRATLVRIAVGLEDVEDLIADLEQAFTVL